MKTFGLEFKRLTATIENFIDESMERLSSGATQIESRHIDELVESLPEDLQEQVAIAAELFRILIDKYEDYSHDYMAMLVISTGDTEEIRPSSLAALSDTKLDLSPPPELYIVKRSLDRMTPNICEEYIVPVPQNIVSVSDDSVYAYSKSHKNEKRETFLNGLYFEHYPVQGITHDWS